MMLVGGTYVPVSHTMNFSKDMLMTTGLVFYYGTKKGYRVISPTLEAGFFSSVGLLSASSTVPTYIGGTSLGAFNQITSVAAVTGSGVVGGVGSLGYETTATATGMFYDLASGSAESGVYLMSSGVILSYTAVTALPAQMAISVVEGPIFITYDGPRVVIAVAKGNFVGYDDYPTGSVINLEKEKKAGNIKILTDDPKIIKKVLDAEMEGQKAKANKGKSK
jgi:hypothetical protein